MRIFLDMYYEQTKSEDIGGLLGGLQLCTDIPNWENNLTTWDEAAWQDWMDGIQKTMLDHKITADPKSLIYNKELAYDCMKNYLELFFMQVPFPDIGKIVWMLNNAKHINDDPVWNAWQQAINHSIDKTWPLDNPLQ